MCLKVKYRLNPDEDIVVYKVLRKWEEGTLTAPFYTFEYRKGLEYNSNITALAERPMGGIYIEEAFHSFKNVEDAESLLTYLQNNNLDAEYVIGVFVIPKNTEVYEGEYVGGIDCYYEDSYASEKIIFKGELEI